MKPLHVTDFIQAPRQRVWDTMFHPDSYRIWTAAFTEGSCFEGSWEQGARIRFLDTNGDGITSVIAESRPCEFLSIRHLGLVKGGVEDFDSEEARSWAPATENYSFTEEGVGTRVDVRMDITEAFEDYLRKTWPLALARLKALCESAP